MTVVALSLSRTSQPLLIVCHQKKKKNCRGLTCLTNTMVWKSYWQNILTLVNKIYISAIHAIFSLIFEFEFNLSCITGVKNVTNREFNYSRMNYMFEKMALFHCMNLRKHLTQFERSMHGIHCMPCSSRILNETKCMSCCCRIINEKTDKRD